MALIVSKRQLDRIKGYFDKGVEQGARIVPDGPVRDDASYFVEPTMFADVDNGMVIAQEEIFGLVVCILRLSDEASALKLSNDVPYGLSGRGTRAGCTG